MVQAHRSLHTLGDGPNVRFWAKADMPLSVSNVHFGVKRTWVNVVWSVPFMGRYSFLQFKKSKQGRKITCHEKYFTRYQLIRAGK
jgi:hypothetical protein